jgi:hypothetical protein
MGQSHGNSDAGLDAYNNDLSLASSDDRGFKFVDKIGGVL